MVLSNHYSGLGKINGIRYMWMCK